ncbi:MAG: hypothetical protein ACQEXJ_18110 [Myxococcota bacterium]
MREAWGAGLIGLMVALGGAGCGDDGGEDTGADAVIDALPDAEADADAAEPDVMPDTAPDEGPDVPEADADAADGGDGDVPEEEELPPLPTRQPLPTPTDPLEGAEVESCAVYQEERCVEGARQRCAVYDPAAESFVAEPDGLLHRALLFDRWRDLYNSPDGQAIDRNFVGETLPGTPESEWGDPAHFEAYWGAGDGGIWTGWATVAAVLRYSETGTEADYQRMEQQVRDLVTMYEVTGIPGYMTRNHYLLLPEGGPNTPEHNLRWEGPGWNPNHHQRPVPDPESVPDLPEAYLEGIPNGEGELVQGTPMWQGRPSIDQNSGPMTALPMAWGLLRDEDLKARIVHNLTCYLKRLQRIELVNLQDNPDLVDGLVSYFSAGELSLDPGDIDFTEMDRIVGYVHRQVNDANEDTFDRSCPDTVQVEPWRVIDASSDDFPLEMLDLVADMDTDDDRPNQIDHFYFPSLRGGDAMHMMHLATMAHHFTGDEQYREFLYETLVDDLDTIGVMHTAGAFDLPKFCKKYYGDQITFGPWWAFLHLLDESPLLDEVQQAYHHEMWTKLMKDAGNVDFDIMYAGALPDDVAVDKAEVLAEGLAGLEEMGGNGGLLMGEPFATEWLNDPRRRYHTTPADILASAPEGVEAACPSEDEIAVCSADIEVLGVSMPSTNAWKTRACSGSEWECEVGEEDGEAMCTDKMANVFLPLPLRAWTDYLWQRNPFQLGKPASVQGDRQYAGSDVSVPYWNARRYDFVTEGEGQVLAWEEVGTCE